jgi:hypothetical protein
VGKQETSSVLWLDADGSWRQADPVQLERAFSFVFSWKWKQKLGRLSVIMSIIKLLIKSALDWLSPKLCLAFWIVTRDSNLGCTPWVVYLQIKDWFPGRLPSVMGQFYFYMWFHHFLFVYSVFQFIYLLTYVKICSFGVQVIVSCW